MKRALLMAALCLLLSACSLPQKQEELSDEEVVNALVLAFRQGDYEAMQPYIDADNPLHTFFSNMDDAVGGEMAPVYRAYLEQLQSLSCTAQAVEGEEAWGTVDVTLSIPNYSAAIRTAMAEAIAEDVSTGNGAFYNMPGWLLRALDSGETAEESYQLHVGSRDGNMVMDTNTNRQFFAALLGGLKPYLNASMTTCTSLEGVVWEFAAQGDELVGMLRQEAIAGASQYPEDVLEAAILGFETPYEAIDGAYAHGEVLNDAIYSRLGLDLNVVSSYTLVQMGLLSQRITAGSNGWISLQSTISSFTRDGATCVTEDFKAQEAE